MARALSILCCLALGLCALAATARADTVPLIVDTDVFSDADDVGALATAFGLQLQGEAKVIAVAVNKRASRAAVATNSWRCVAAITSFYDSPTVPIGTAMPNDGSSAGDGGFATPCARSAPASTPTPDSAVGMYRRALAAQADGSVVIASAGFLGNLAALLDSAPDGISPLSGRELIARKVARLVAMAGGYPHSDGESNTGGDPASAQDVADHWPTKVVWSGFEVGENVLTGQTISGQHPAESPVRVAYEAFVGPDTAISSWDLTAVYHAVRPDDPLLREVGPGTNVVGNDGSNTFTEGPGDQFYLRNPDPRALEDAIEALLDTLEAPPDRAPPVIGDVAAGSITTSGATISWGTDEPATTQVEYGATTAYGSATAHDASLANAHSQSLAGLSPGTLYHYRVQSTDAAGNVATSPDFTFTTAAPPDTTTPAAEPPATAPAPDASPSALATPPRPVAATPRCVVPTLRGRTLDGARRLLRRHRCTLGRITRPRHKQRLRVFSQNPQPRTIRRASGRVDITLRQRKEAR